MIGDKNMIEQILFSIGFCIFFVISFLILQASRLEECFKKGKTAYIIIAYVFISFIAAFIITYGLNYLTEIIIPN